MRVVRTLEVDRIIRMGAETVSSAAQMEQQRDQPLSPVIPVLEAQENCSVAVENQGEPNQPIRISFTELHVPQVGLPTHTQMIGAQMDGQMSLEVCGEGHMGPLTYARMAATPAVVPVVDRTSSEVQRGGQVPPGTAVAAPVVDRTSSGVQRGGQVPPGTCGKSQKCPLCGQGVFSVKRHIEMEHLPWYFAPEIACWVCQECVENRCCLEERHKACLCSLGGHFTEERFLAWLQTMKELLHELAVLFGLRDIPALLRLCLRERLYPQDNGTTLSPPCEAYMLWLEEYQGGAVGAVEIKPLNCSAAILNWTTMLGLLRRLTPLQRNWVQHFPLSAAQLQTPEVMVIDGHCHLDMLAREWKTSAEGAIQRTLQPAPDPRMRLHAVVSNCCFPRCWGQILQVSLAVRVRWLLPLEYILVLLAIKWTGNSWTPWSRVRTVWVSESVAWTTLDLTWDYRRWCFGDRFIWQNRSRNRWCYICAGRRGRMTKPIWMLCSCYGRRTWVVGILYTFTVSLPHGQCTWNGSAASITFFWGWPRSPRKQMILQRWPTACLLNAWR